MSLNTFEYNALTPLEGSLNTGRWTDGNPNLDNDVNIAWYYLCTSSQILPPLGEIDLAYTTLISHFSQFNEMYWAPEADVKKVADHIIAKLRENPSWMTEVLQQIYATCDQLENFSRQHLKKTSFSELSDSELKALFDTHTQLHLAVYNYARIPEALDRGYELFSKLLKNHLQFAMTKQALSAPSPKELNRAFSTLIAPTESSVLDQAELTLLQLAADIIDDPTLTNGQRQADLLDQPLKFVWLYLQPSYRERIKDFVHRYGSTIYHGYANRQAMTETEVIDKIRSLINNAPHQVIARKKDRLISNESEREAAFDHYQIDKNWQDLYKLYPQIGLTKMYRRNAQLVNFMFLDKLLYEIARRHNLPEAAVRGAIPPELSALLDSSQPELQHDIHTKLQTRHTQNFLYYIKDLTHGVIDNPDLVADILARISASYEAEIDPRYLTGSQVWPGQTEGTVIVAFRPDDLKKAIVPPNTIVVIVSGSTDPDLMYAINEWRQQKKYQVGAILTETGGITCHAAITAREQEIPTIVGISGLLKALSTGDRVKVNADEGWVSRLETAQNINKVIPFPNVTDTFGLTASDLGVKAFNLALLHQHQDIGDYKITPAFFLPPDVVADELQKARRHKSVKNYAFGDELIQMIYQSCRGLNWTDLAEIMIRSSCRLEDTNGSAAAGYFDSIPDLTISNIIEQLRSYIFINSRGKNGRSPYEGSIIIQEQVNPTLSGVMFTKNPTPSNGLGHNSMIIEAVNGQNRGVTSGNVKPTRFILDRDSAHSGNIRQIIPGTSQALLTSQHLQKLATLGLFIEQTMQDAFQKKPADLEWGIVGDTVYLFQARPITTT